MIPPSARVTLSSETIWAIARGISAGLSNSPEGDTMIPHLWRTLAPPPDPPDLPYRDPLRERWFPTWVGAMIHACGTAQRLGVAFEVRRDREFGAWVARPRKS